jgi:tRNA dimethylallyltransferase
MSLEMPVAEGNSMSLPPAIFLVGPTASGKTDLAFELCRTIPCDIISVDSAQVFRDMNIGTAKPDAATLAQFPHRLIDLIDPHERYSAARFCSDALAAMAEISAAGRIPLLVGGTMLYVKALREGLADLPSADPEVRAAIESDALQRGWPALHGDLAELDPVTAARLKATDSQRIQRALEIIRISGQPLSTLFSQQTRTELPYQSLTIGLQPSDRAVLHQRIGTRFDAMLALGLVDEVDHLRNKYPLTEDMPSMRCVGYRQVWEMLEGKFPHAELRDRGVFATRQFAKRQLTWLRSTADLEVVDPLAVNFTDTVVTRVGAFLAQCAGAKHQ